MKKIIIFFLYLGILASAFTITGLISRGISIANCSLPPHKFSDDISSQGARMKYVATCAEKNWTYRCSEGMFVAEYPGIITQDDTKCKWIIKQPDNRKWELIEEQSL